MKDNSFIIILLLFGLVVYLANNNIKKRSNDVLHESNVNVLKSEIDSIKTSYIELKSYVSELESICDTYKSSSEAKEVYHRSMPNYANLFE